QIGMVFQNPSSYMNPILKVSTQFIESIRSHKNVTVEEARKTAVSCLKKVALKNPEKIMEGYLHELSGGMQQRVYIAMVMANAPKLLLADEPTSALDVVVGRAIADELLSLKRTMDTSMLIVTHDIALAAYLSDRILVMKDGLIVESGYTDVVIKNPQHQYTRELLSTVRCLERG
ncbi:MAG: ABC transporter ATP-binding protein, partial [Clostridia bacterium]|nr:ABC transporter ATP-binding protein [Clostridia bacterium]